MAYLKCNVCGRTLDSIYFSKVGLRCGVNNCDGIFEFAGGYTVYVDRNPKVKLDLQCRRCAHICSSIVTKLKVGSTCPIPGCYGSMDRYWGH